MSEIRAARESESCSVLPPPEDNRSKVLSIESLVKFCTTLDAALNSTTAVLTVIPLFRTAVTNFGTSTNAVERSLERTADELESTTRMKSRGAD